mgnify:CR=1 FL=1
MGLDRVDVAYVHDPDDHLEQAIEEVKRCSGSQFDPDISPVFVDVIEKLPGGKVTRRADAVRLAESMR